MCLFILSGHWPYPNKINPFGETFDSPVARAAVDAVKLMSILRTRQWSDQRPTMDIIAFITIEQEKLGNGQLIR